MFSAAERAYHGPMVRQRVAESVSREIVRLCHAGLDGPTLTRAALSQLRKAVPVDAFWCASTDPATILFTGTVKEEIPEYATPYFLANELLHDDVNKFTSLARGGES